jgi:SAM-dependent methyltransferase
MPDDPTARFTHRVKTYVQARPDYPAALLQHLRREIGLQPDWLIADIGSGTGLLSRLFLEAGFTLIGVEPNPAMRQAGESQLAGYPRFRSLPDRAEQLSLPNASLDLIVAGQAFHWFDPLAARREFARVLRSPAPVALVWNDRNDDTPLELGYRQLMLEFAPEYQSLRLDPSSDQTLAQFFAPSPMITATFEHEQWLDQAGLLARVTSSSCAPLPDHPGYPAMQARVDQLFQSHQQAGRVRLSYTTRLYWGYLTP